MRRKRAGYTRNQVNELISSGSRGGGILFGLGSGVREEAPIGASRLRGVTWAPSPTVAR
jgi:hypothetical protein